MADLISIGLLITLTAVVWLLFRANRQIQRLSSDLRRQQHSDPPVSITATTQNSQSSIQRMLLRPLIDALQSEAETHLPRQTLLQFAAFILGEEHVRTEYEAANPIVLVDQIVGLLEPLRETNQIQITVLPDQNLPCRLSIQTELFQQTLFHLLLNHLQSGVVVDVVIKLSYDNARIHCHVSPSLTDEPTQHLGRLLKQLEYSEQTLQLPTHRPIFSNHESIQALVLSNNPDLRSSLVARLHTLGVTSTHDFEGHLSFCLIDRIDSEAYQAIQHHLTNIPVVCLSDDPNAGGFTLQEPLQQSELTTVVDNIRSRKGRELYILLVDDNATNLHLLESQLTELGHSVAKVTSGPAALEQLQSSMFDLVFLDIQMPEWDGIRTVREIRRRQNNTPVIALTAHATPAERQQYRDAGMNEIMIKPARLDSLQTILTGVSRNPQPTLSHHGVRQVFDSTLALRRADDRPDLAQELLELLIENLPNDLAAINNASADLVGLKNRGSQITWCSQIHGRA